MTAIILITKFYRPATWGYNLFYYLAASNDCHPNYVSFLMEKRTLSVRQIDGLLKAKKNGLWPEFLGDSYVYLIKKDGTDGVFKGMNKDKNKEVEAPYVVCPVHTQKAWEEYQASLTPDVPGPGEDQPTDPNDPEFPGGLEPVG